MSKKKHLQSITLSPKTFSPINISLLDLIQFASKKFPRRHYLTRWKWLKCMEVDWQETERKYRPFRERACFKTERRCWAKWLRQCEFRYRRLFSQNAAIMALLWHARNYNLRSGKFNSAPRYSHSFWPMGSIMILPKRGRSFHLILNFLLLQNIHILSHVLFPRVINNIMPIDIYTILYELKYSSTFESFNIHYIIFNNIVHFLSFIIKMSCQ